jgi:cytochrome c oxidase cbb3-type subunit I/II
MPPYRHLLSEKLNYREIPKRVWAAYFLGAPYDEELTNAEDIARTQAQVIAAEIISQGGPVTHKGILLEESTAIALIAYLQRMGTDLFKTGTDEAAAEPPTAVINIKTQFDSAMAVAQADKKAE